MHAGIASLIAFSVGGIGPLLTTLLPPAPLRIPLTFIMVLVALAATGYTSARVAHSPFIKAIVRNVSTPARSAPGASRRRARLPVASSNRS